MNALLSGGRHGPCSFLDANIPSCNKDFSFKQSSWQNVVFGEFLFGGAKLSGALKCAARIYFFICYSFILCSSKGLVQFCFCGASHARKIGGKAFMFFGNSQISMSYDGIIASDFWSSFIFSRDVIFHFVLWSSPT